ncbi:MAG: CinA family nicotinamide mononucleotide deamidase-related protein [Fibrobacteraceae bacterium]|nr:CinA family nicotinamide mononucleotide deamidase-related protein [Fibrobacteraceae bacterium]
MNQTTNNKVAIVNLGTELTQGFTLNTNAHWIAGRLRDMGFDVSYQITLPDDASVWTVTWEMIRKADASTVILSGGLGPTEDDKTRDLIATTFNAPLEYIAEWEKPIKAYFAKKGKAYPASNKIQACFPQGSKVLDNPIGTAPGFSISKDGITLFAVPGVPREAREMFDRHVAPYLSTKHPSKFFSRELRLSGISESDMGERFSKVNFHEGTSWSSLPVKDSIIFRTYSHESAETLEKLEKQLIQALGDKDLIVSTDGKNMVETIAELLKSRKETLSTAESCTGGLIASEIVNLPGASDFFKGGAVTYWNDAKRDILGVPQEMLDQFGAVSEEVVKAMAKGALKHYNTDWAVATSGVAGPDGGSTEKPVGFVWMAVASNRKIFAFNEKFSGDREQIRNKSVFKVLNTLRIAILTQKSTCTKVQ